MKYFFNGLAGGLLVGLTLGFIIPDPIMVSVEDEVNLQTGYLAGLLISLFALIGVVTYIWGLWL